MTDTYIIDSGRPIITKDPQATLDYPFDWSAYLAPLSDSLVTATFTASSGTITDDTLVDAIATAWVSGGVVGTTITLTCHITTLGGRIDERSVFIKIRER